jgi:hypothetical protein
MEAAMSEIKFNVNLAGDLKKILDRKEIAMREVVADVKARILQNTSQGLDFEDKPFKEYNPRYEEKRALSGRTRIPNLNLTGQMLRDLQVSVTRMDQKIEGKVFIQDGRSTAPAAFGGETTSSVEKAKKVTIKRKFIGVQKSVKEKLIEKVRNA